MRGRFLPTLPTAPIARQQPNGRMDSRCHFTLQASGDVEPMEYPSHGYEGSMVNSPDATRPMRKVCMGSHGVFDAVTLPLGALTR